MNLIYQGVNRRGRAEWIDEALPQHPMEEWELVQYRKLVEGTEPLIGRELTTAERRTLQWLASSEESSGNVVLKLIGEAHRFGSMGADEVAERMNDYLRGGKEEGT